MPQYVALLRGINVGGHRVTMERLRGLFEALRFADVSTFIASGNVIFRTPERKPAAIERRIEEHLHEALGYEVATFLRTPSEIAAIAALRPFGDPETPGHTIHAAFLREPIPGAAAERLLALRTTFDDFLVGRDREFFWLCRGRSSDTLVPASKLAKAIAGPTTMRNMTMLRKLAAQLA